ncbi:winged helix-turn-helix transcriptional regulator [Candidatus Woesearchaeota archaeon]|nr:winged helix-turn-helix transcriptional regulator [Candidatus Woesearchaeota archaeon]
MPLPPHLFDEILHKALASDIRRRILLSLSKKDKYLSEIAAEVEKKPQTVNFHLNVLSEIGLIEGAWKEGKKYYSLMDKKIIGFISERKPIPERLHKPPHEIVADAMDKFSKRLDRIEEKLDMLLGKKL